MNLEELLNTETAVEAFCSDRSGSWLVVSDSELGPNLYDLTVRYDEAMPPQRTYTGERMVDIKAIIQAEGYNIEELSWYAIEEE